MKTNHELNVKRVAIIGAGFSGLTAIKACLEEGLQPICFEMAPDIGGIWNYCDEVLINRSNCVMKSTITNTSKELTSFSDFPMPKNYPNYLRHTDMLEYLKLYVNKFNLIDYIVFNYAVRRVTKVSDYDVSGKWIVCYEVINSQEDDKIYTEIFDAVIVCSGVNSIPFEPKIKGLNDDDRKFKGDILHACMYRNSNGFENKNVLVVGAGNSGSDIAVDLCRMASKVYLSIRNGIICMSRLGSNGLPIDYVKTSRFSNSLLKLKPLRQLFLKRIQQFDHKLYGLKPSPEALTKRFTVNDELPLRILSGEIIIKSKCVEFYENSCVFDDGTQVNNINAVIFSTGYEAVIPFLEKENIVDYYENMLCLYKSVFSPNLKHANLAFVGFIGNRGSITILSELQARWTVRVMKGFCKLPSREAMMEDIENKRNKVLNKFDQDRHFAVREFGVDYTDELAELIGCKPNLCK